MKKLTRSGKRLAQVLLPMGAILSGCADNISGPSLTPRSDGDIAINEEIRTTLDPGFRPDFVVTQMSGQFVRFQPVVSVTVANQGSPMFQGDVIVNLYGFDEEAGTWLIDSKTVRFSRLQATRTLTFYPSCEDLESRYPNALLVAKVDPDDGIVELNESNNQRLISFDVGPCP